MDNPANLFLYELATMYDAERKSNQLLSEAVGLVREGDTARILRTQEQEGQQKVRNLDACFQALGTGPREVPCAVVDGLRTEFQAFFGTQPSAEVLEMYTVGSALKLAHLGVAGYKDLVDKSMLMGQTECAQLLQTNLVMKEESAGRLERTGHEMGQRMLASA
jgi:ferritin-like metal-binding protein YciE